MGHDVISVSLVDYRHHRSRFREIKIWSLTKRRTVGANLKEEALALCSGLWGIEYGYEDATATLSQGFIYVMFIGTR